MSALSQALDFPEYFGENWDALEECVRDLSWLSDGTVELVHKDVPLTNDLRSLKVYLSILGDAVEKFRSQGSSRLVVAFPEDMEQLIRSVERSVSEGSSGPKLS